MTKRADLLDMCQPFRAAFASYDNVVRAALQLPLDKHPLEPADFYRPMYDMAYAVAVELSEIADTDPVAREAWQLIETARNQPDLSQQQWKATHVEALVDMLVYWLTHTAGGLKETIPIPRRTE